MTGWMVAVEIAALWVITWLRRQRDVSLLDSLISLHRKVDNLMATETELQATLDQIKADTQVVADKLAAQTKTIADLQAQVAAGTPVSQEQLDALKAEADGIHAALAAAAA